MENKVETHKLFRINQNAIIENDMGEILILKKDEKWMLPGGRLEDNETSLEGLQREVKEETNIGTLSVEKILSVEISDSGETYIVIFLCKSGDVSEVKLSDEHQDYAWFKIVDAKKYEFWHEKIKERLIELIEAK